MKKFAIPFVLLSFLSIHSLPLQAKSYEPSLATKENTVRIASVTTVPKVQKTSASPVVTVQTNSKPVAPTIKPQIKTTPTPKPIPASAPQPTPVTKPTPAPTTDCNVGTINTQFLCLLNDYRKSKGLNTLIEDPLLDATAIGHSTWMNTNHTMSHVGENGSKFFERCQAQGTSCDAENVAMNYTTAQTLFTAWKNSPDHNANMLGHHTKTGFSLVGMYATSIFK